ncbi:hypothetical protein HYH02_011890 [Chlamydomonas schloesseri]|uniref:Histone-binding protein RBBP4-like N-terminal domain-containing protein n=1 Tax=Chlamydomonas schloesseri TaxID=2026947 RepID=A0A835W372_9CHLO|nr:hypothetical protein HYH02_011890 [Chlamydomonas schloesseri]|eukprot:KAG2435598.1 hypothetical protein HYH02_011890 [Chlamydomonas schloesseri]
MALLSDDSFDAYKRRFVPILYDWFMHYHLPYPTQTCRWGPLVEDLGYKSRYRAYLSEQVVDGERPNTLLLAHIDVMKPHVASCEAVSNWQDKSVSSHVTIVRTVYHPGEVNKVRELPSAPHVVVTHTDSKHLYVWNMERQPDRRPAASGVAAAAAAAASAGKSKRGGDKGGDASSSPSVADLVLTGHEDEALFPLACSSAAPCVASGGNDQLVLLWDLADSMTSLAAVPPGSSGSGKEAEGGAAASTEKSKAPQLKARTRLQGHTATVGDVCFAPGSAALLVSVADDGRLLLWDTRSGLAPVGCVEEAHSAGVNVMCVDWCPVDEHLLVSGAEQGSIKVWDRRRVGAGAAGALFSFDAHTNNAEERDIIHVEWHPRNKDVFASGSVDRTVAIWDLSRGRPTPAAAPAGAAAGAAATAAAEPEAAAAGKDKGAGGEVAPAEGGKEKGGDVEMADAGASAGAAVEAGAAAEAAKEGAAAGEGEAAAEEGKAEATGEGSDATAAAATAAGEAEPKPQAEGEKQPGQEGKDADGADKGGKKEEAAGAAGAAEGAEPPKKKKKTDKDKDKGGPGDKAEDDGLPTQLIFQHLGHRLGRVTDFQWHPDPAEPWTLISVSDNTGDEAADGTLQVWRISDLIYRPYEEAVQELEQHRQFILHGNTGPSGGTDAGKGASAAAGGGKGKEAKAEQA